MAHSARSKSKLRAKKEKVSKRGSDYAKINEERKERLAQKLQENLQKQKPDGTEAPAMEVDKKVSTSGWRSSRNNLYKKNHTRKKNKSIKF
ncbi:hypothetical protein KL948_004650 [Ogataea haglerorum]|uniref:DUF2423 domain-containing protein n=1 Tax=Ogataea haglerorum TaxID=1937702 RepID=A0ABQ7RAT0_9ASCO|nr:uncharacterized protein KL911_004928 [Ogataea haglerorum]KAG7692318.1 hypothetical protein KL915_004749 [Ogataea haglerorum]KAG7703119.1 hypothetical protein KL914_004900 [Ogataea haglerorum]KAG7703242.1 hypothetical protein KL950_004876 [Ogataea haglerorum]KAG7726668.1 hypothetical protein KL948_004650 [Ogataea haglerorum]KAG7736350.1 hypothetical protein KL923_004816 [Ogataea haglerorum]